MGRLTIQSSPGANPTLGTDYLASMATRQRMLGANEFELNVQTRFDEKCTERGGVWFRTHDVEERA